MTTVHDLIVRALRLNGVNQAGETPTADEAEAGLQALNGMLNSWEGLGINLEFLGFTELTQVIPYPDDHLSAFAYNLAVETAPEYGVAITDVLASRATTYFKMLQAQYADPDILTIDPGLLISPL